MSNICARHGEPTEVTHTPQPRHDAARSEPLVKKLVPKKQLVIEKHAMMATAKSSSDLTRVEVMSVCTPRAGAFDSVAVERLEFKFGGVGRVQVFGITCCYGVYRVSRFSRRLPLRRL